MATEIVIVVFVILLLGYIIFLHVQLAKKNLYIETTISRLSEIEKNLSPEQMRHFLNEIRKTHRYSSFFTEKLFEEKPLHFLLGNAGDSSVFIHYTKEQSDAMNIIKEGFRFADSFYKTALPVSRDRLDLLVKHNSRKSFGDYLIVLCISDILFDYYAGQLEKNDLKAFAVENVLTETPLSLIHISEPTRLLSISYAVFCLKKKKKNITPSSRTITIITRKQSHNTYKTTSHGTTTYPY